MKKVKIFTSYSRYDLEMMINEFLKDNEMVDIKFFIGENGLYSILIIYME